MANFSVRILLLLQPNTDCFQHVEDCVRGCTSQLKKGKLCLLD